VQATGSVTDIGYSGPRACQLADWRLQMQSLYAVLRGFDDHAEAHALWKARRNELLATHPCSPLNAEMKMAFRGLNAFVYNPAFRFEVDVTDEKGSMQFQDLGTDGPVHFQKLGKTVGLATALGCELSVYWMLGYGGGLFIPFRDGTAGGDTFRTGRILVDAVKGADFGMSPHGKLILDFNFAYHPDRMWDSTLDYISVPDENHISCAVPAGERR
tara:strand:- start:10511 stop:11155 length:645 start_codon:yes stop_codon:yes gene_type:complete